MRRMIGERWVGGGPGLVAAVLVAVTVPWTPPAHADQSAPQAEYLFSLNAERGTSTRVGKDTGEKRFVLTLHGVSDRATQFADRPFRNAYLLSTRTLVKKWDTWFRESRPNAVLTFTYPERFDDPAPHAIVVKLLKPRYSPKTGTLRVTAKHLHRTVSPVNGDKVTLPKRRPPARFTGASLFIDTVSFGTVVNGCTLQENTSCPGADLSNEYLNGVDLSGSNFEGADFSGSYVPDVQFTQALLNQAKFVDAKAPTPVNFSNATLDGADLTRAQFPDSAFTDAVLRGADLTDANLRNAELTRAQLAGATLRRADLRGAKLENAVFAGASLDQALTDGNTRCPNGSSGPCTTADQWRPQAPLTLP